MATAGVTSSTAGGRHGRRRAASRARPDPRRAPAPPARKNGTSEPSPAATRAAGRGSSSAPHASRAPSSAAAASADPPPRPAATGMRFSSRAASGGVGRAARPLPDGLPRRRDRPQDRGCPAPVPCPGRRHAACPRGRRAARLRRSARASGTNTECRSWKPSARRPRTASVRLSLAGARRRTRPASVPALMVRHSRRPRRSSAIGPSVSRRRSHSSTASVCGRRSRAIPAAARAAIHAPRVDGELPRQDVAEHLAALAEARLDEPPQAVLLAGRRAGVAVVRLHDDDRRLDRRRRLECAGRDLEGDPHPGVVLHEHGQVAHLPGRRGDPLGDLALDHQDEALRARRLAEQAVQDRAGDVVREVGHDVVRRRHEADEVLVQGVALDEAQLAASRAGPRIGRAGRRRARDPARPP